MKKTMAVSVLILTAFAASAFAGTKVGMDAEREAHRMEMKKIKAALRENRKTAPTPVSNGQPGFWEKEGQRSGLGDGGNRVGTFLRNLNPVPFFKSQQEAYNSRKAGGVK